MDPRQPRRSQKPVGIPRTRGDGPSSSRTSSTACLDSPHPRGWTRLVDIDDCRLHGFPAPAGMDPRRSLARCEAVRIPRTRGDGPVNGDYIPGVHWDSPHPRGWTRLRPRRSGHHAGFPAPAGMDPFARASAVIVKRIPRTRGDGPCPLSWSSSRARDSPHPRGWTRGGGERAERDDGFPAPAGMDPPRPGAGSRRGRIPRTRGDGPVADRDTSGTSGDSPHPRGWTRLVENAEVRLGGFPAPAGMDPRRG